MQQLCGVLFLCGLLKLCGLLIFFLLLISLMAGHAAIVRCAIFVQFARIEPFAKKNLRSKLQKLTPVDLFSEASESSFK